MARILLLKLCAKLIVFIKDIILNPDFIARHKKNKSDFTRERSLPFFNVIVFLLNLLRSSLQNELDKFFHTLSDADVPVREVPAPSGAFYQARKKLKHQAFIELNTRSTDYFYENFDTLRWHGFRLLATDGSTTQLPRTQRNWKYFGGLKPASGGECPMARLSQMFDVLSNVTVDALLAPYFVSEEILAKQHFKLLKPKDLATSLLDMALYPYELFKDLYHKRWPVEEQYELFKSRIEIANFTGKSVEAVKQDFHARVFMSNLTPMLAFPVHAQITEKYKDAKLDYKINWTQALAKMKISGILLFFRKLPIRIIKKLQSLFLKNISAVRPGRKYPKKPKLIKKSYAFAYKPIS